MFRKSVTGVCVAMAAQITVSRYAFGPPAPLR